MGRGLSVGFCPCRHPELGEQEKSGRAAGISQGKREFSGCGEVPLPVSSTPGISQGNRDSSGNGKVPQPQKGVVITQAALRPCWCQDCQELERGSDMWNTGIGKGSHWDTAVYEG